jgi:hypothetical protein
VQVSAESFNYVTAPQSLSFRFTGDVAASIDAADLRVTDLNTGLFIGVNTPNVSFDGTTTIATFTFSASTGASLHDGNYRATLLAAGITDPAGKAIDGDANGSSGGDHRFDFFFLSGDANYDRKVNIVDLSILAANWQQTQRTFAQGDFNYDGLVDAADLRILATNWQKSLEVVPLRWSITRVARLMPAPQQAPRQSGVEPLPGDLSDPHDGELFVL